MQHILFEKSGGIGTITLNRPEKYNALVDTMREDILACLQDPEPRVFVITGAGKAFCAGGDVEVMVRLKKAGDREGFRELLEAGRRVVTTLRALPKPVVAAVNGVAAGAGCNLALACDLRVASVDAGFVQSFVKIGLHPDWGGTFLAPALLGTGRAAEMFFTGDPIDAPNAYPMGMVNRVVPSHLLAEEVKKLAEKLAKAAPLAIAAAKKALYAGQDLSAALDHEIEAQMRLFDSADFAEGLAAFREKREALFKGA